MSCVEVVSPRSGLLPRTSDVLGLCKTGERPVTLALFFIYPSGGSAERLAYPMFAVWFNE
jgi:hypothetical protein